MAKLFRLLLSFILCVSLVFANVLQNPPVAHAQLASEEVSCSVDSEKLFRQRLEIILQDVLRDTVQSLNYLFVVETSWTKHDIDKKVDALVDREVKRLRNDKSVFELVQTLAYKEARDRLARELAEGVYGSEQFKQAIALIAEDVGASLSQKLDVLSVRAADPISKCVQKFVGPQYGSTIASFVSTQTRNQMSFNPDSSGANTSITDIIKETSGGLTGGLLIVLRRTIVQRLSRVLGRRLVGALVTRAVGAAVSIIGWILVAKEVWDLRLGVLPIVAKEMKSKEAKERIRTELVSELKVEVDRILKDVPADISEGVFKLWTDFKEQNAKTVALAKKHVSFQRFLEDVDSRDETLKIERLRKTNKVVSLLLDISNEDTVLAAMNDGTLRRAVVDLPEVGVQIAVDNRSLDTAFAWYDLAGTRLDDVVKYDLHKRAEPESFSKTSLKKLFSVGNVNTLRQMVELDTRYRNALLNLPDRDFKAFSNEFSGEQLSALSLYLDALEPERARQIVFGIQNNPRKMNLLSRQQVRNGILRSVNQEKAISYILRQTSSFEFLKFPDDAQLVLNGEISPSLVWYKQPFAVMVTALFMIFIVLILYRIFFGRRRKVVVQEVVKSS